MEVTVELRNGYVFPVVLIPGTTLTVGDVFEVKMSVWGEDVCNVQSIIGQIRSYDEDGNEITLEVANG